MADVGAEISAGLTAFLAGNMPVAANLLRSDASFQGCLARGQALLALRRIEDADEAFRAALALDPDNAVARLNLASLAYAAGRHVPTEDDPGTAPAMLDAIADLHDGTTRKAFTRILAALDSALVASSVPRWEGSENPALRLLVICDQGHGDCIQFARYLASARRRVGRLTVAVYPPLIRLFSTIEGVDHVIPIDAYVDELRRADAYIVPILLPAALGASYGTGSPYIAARPPARSKRLRVGICWAGNPAHPNDPNRSMPLAILAPLGGLAGVDLHSLQVGQRAGEERPGGLAIEDHQSELRDFADTAALIGELDVVVSIDSAVAHLAGAMGKPTWIMLPHAAEWRWGTGDATAWYPSARLFRQSSPGDWGYVVDRVAHECAILAAAASLGHGSAMSYIATMAAEGERGPPDGLRGVAGVGMREAGRSPLPQPHPGRLAIGEFNAGHLESALNRGEVICHRNRGSALEIPDRVHRYI